MDRITRISRVYRASDRRNLPAVIEGEACREAPPSAPAPRATLEPGVPTVQRQTASAALSCQLMASAPRRGLKADANERARYARAYAQPGPRPGLIARAVA